jgi:hypothetical protein
MWVVQTPTSLRIVRGPGPDYDPRDYSEALEAKYLDTLRVALAESGLSLTVEELQGCMKSYASFHDIHDDERLRSADGRAFLDRWLDRMKDLWNYTPRAELGGRRPTDHLQDLLERGAPRSEIAACLVVVPSDFHCWEVQRTR